MSIPGIDVLGIAAHPDDVELSCAGTMLLAKSQGKKTAILDLTRGELSTRGTLETRAKETEAASKILQLDYRENLDLPDGGLYDSPDNALKVVRAIRDLQPTIVLFPHTYERHPDHAAASQIVHRAIFLSGLAKIETTNAKGEEQTPHRPLLALHYMQTFSFQPKIVIDVTSVFSKRMEAVHAYGSQFARPRNQSSRVGTAHELKEDSKHEEQTFLTQSGFFEWIESRARTYGMIVGAEFGEPFWSHEVLGTKDLFALVTKKVS